MTTLLLRCGCTVPFDVKGSAPVCAAHGNQPVVRVLGMPKPRIRGMASGPCVQTVDLPPFVGRLAGNE
jgi:hypothetical protein